MCSRMKWNPFFMFCCVPTKLNEYFCVDLSYKGIKEIGNFITLQIIIHSMLLRVTNFKYNFTVTKKLQVFKEKITQFWFWFIELKMFAKKYQKAKLNCTGNAVESSNEHKFKENKKLRSQKSLFILCWARREKRLIGTNFHCKCP